MTDRTVIPPKSTVPGMLNYRGYTPSWCQSFMEFHEETPIKDVLRVFEKNLCTTCISQTGIIYRKDGRGWHASKGGTTP